jgi:hypothetical protein
MATAKSTSKASSTPRAMSLHVALNAVSTAHYGGWSGELGACEADARDMAAIASAQGMKPALLLTQQATRAAVLKAVRDAAAKLAAGDLFFLSYSGHGGQMPDATGEEADKKDETWCLFDGELIDDELYLELAAFKPEVRVLVLSDSCHSGTVVRASGSRAQGTNGASRPKLMPPSVAMRTYVEHKAFYDKLQAEVRKRAGRATLPHDHTMAARVAVSPRLTAIANAFAASVILISGCQDNQVAMDGEHNGIFTEQVLHAWNHGAFTGNYARFYAVIKAAMPQTQTPNLLTLGRVAKFVAEEPFSV